VFEAKQQWNMKLFCSNHLLVSNYALKKASAHDRVDHESITKAIADSYKLD
jgi:hypothetical protein